MESNYLNLVHWETHDSKILNRTCETLDNFIYIICIIEKIIFTNVEPLVVRAIKFKTIETWTDWHDFFNWISYACKDKLLQPVVWSEKNLLTQDQLRHQLYSAA